MVGTVGIVGFVQCPESNCVLVTQEEDQDQRTDNGRPKRTRKEIFWMSANVSELGLIGVRRSL